MQQLRVLILYITSCLICTIDLYGQIIDEFSVGLRIKAQSLSLNKLNIVLQNEGFIAIDPLLYCFDIQTTIGNEKWPVKGINVFSVSSSHISRNGSYSSIRVSQAGVGIQETIISYKKVGLSIGGLFNFAIISSLFVKPNPQTANPLNNIGTEIINDVYSLEPFFELLVTANNERISVGLQGSYLHIFKSTSWTYRGSGAAVDLPKIDNKDNFSLGFSFFYKITMPEKSIDQSEKTD